MAATSRKPAFASVSSGPRWDAVLSERDAGDLAGPVQRDAELEQTARSEADHIAVERRTRTGMPAFENEGGWSTIAFEFVSKALRQTRFHFLVELGCEVRRIPIAGL